MVSAIGGKKHMRQKSQKIEDIRRQFRKNRQWLLIEVNEIDPLTTTPIKGRLLAHSPHQDEIFKKSMKAYKHPILVDYSEDTLPKGTAIIFIINKSHA